MAEPNIKSSNKTRLDIHTTASGKNAEADKRSSLDEVIYSLAAAHENKRARQVSEWETSQRF